jgi:hypothetical protein
MPFIKPRPLNARPLNQWDALKLLALVLMVIDHAGLFFFPAQEWMRALGRGAAPIFMFLVGAAASYRFKWDIFLLAILLTISDFAVVWEINTLNMLFTLMAYRAVFAWLERRKKMITRPFEWLVGSLALISTSWIVQYGSTGMIFAVLGYMCKHSTYYEPKQRWAFALIGVTVYATLQNFLFGFGEHAATLATLVLLAITALLMQSHATRPLPALGVALCRPFLPLARYSAYVYVIHLVIFQWMTYRQI